MHTILVVEDDTVLNAGLVRSQDSQGYRVLANTTGEGVVRLAKAETPSLVLLDVQLPLEDGFTICAGLRQSGYDGAVLMLTVRGSEQDRVTGLEAGADDYLVKPFAEAELLARVRACLRRVHRPDFLTGYAFDDVQIDFRTRRVTRLKQPVKITDKEYELLAYLIRHRGQTVSRDALLTEIWGFQNHPATRTVDTHIFMLRHKLEQDPANPRRILSVHGEGYRFL
jgi:DNA-binding response OmpR family regulator